MLPTCSLWQSSFAAPHPAARSWPRPSWPMRLAGHQSLFFSLLRRRALLGTFRFRALLAIFVFSWQFLCKKSIFWPSRRIPLGTLFSFFPFFFFFFFFIFSLSFIFFFLSFSFFFFHFLSFSFIFFHLSYSFIFFHFLGFLGLRRAKTGGLWPATFSQKHGPLSFFSVVPPPSHPNRLTIVNSWWG